MFGAIKESYKSFFGLPQKVISVAISNKKQSCSYFYLFHLLQFRKKSIKPFSLSLSFCLSFSLIIPLYFSLSLYPFLYQTFFFLSMFSSLCSVFLEIFIYVASVYKNPLPPFSILFPNVYLTLFYPK